MVKNQNRTEVKAGQKQRAKKWKIVLLGVMILLFSYFIVVPFIQKIFMQIQLSSKANSVYQKSKVDISKKHEQNIQNDRQALGFSEPVYSASYNTCYVDYEDAGQFADNFFYKCQINYVDLFETPLKYGPLRIDVYSGERLPQSHLKQDTPMYNYIHSYDYMERLNLPSGQVLSPHLYITNKKTSDVNNIVDAWIITKDIKDKAAQQRAADNLVLIGKSGSTTLDPDKYYAIRSEGIEYYQENIGCSIVNIGVSCLSPIGE